jgi:hypothetical protein
MWNAGRTPARMIEVISPAGFEGFFREVADLAAADTLTVLSSAPTGTTRYGAGSRGPGPPMGGQVVPRPLQPPVVRAQAFDPAGEPGTLDLL